MNTHPSEGAVRQGRLAARVVALSIAGIWLLALLVYSVLQPRFRLSKPLFTAVQAGDRTVVQRLLKRGAVLGARDGEGHTALWLAVSRGHLDIADLLLERGAGVDARGNDGWTPLIEAAHSGNVAMVRLLIAHKANVNAEGNFGETALRYAVDEKNAEIEQRLRQAGAIR